jgi:hypothetical protein
VRVMRSSRVGVNTLHVILVEVGNRPGRRHLVWFSDKRGFLGSLVIESSVVIGCRTVACRGVVDWGIVVGGWVVVGRLVVGYRLIAGR